PTIYGPAGKELTTLVKEKESMKICSVLLGILVIASGASPSGAATPPASLAGQVQAFLNTHPNFTSDLGSGLLPADFGPNVRKAFEDYQNLVTPDSDEEADIHAGRVAERDLVFVSRDGIITTLAVVFENDRRIVDCKGKGAPAVFKCKDARPQP